MRTLLLALLLIPQTAPLRPSRIVDTHIHLYDPTRPEGVPWPPKSDPVLYRPVLPAEYRELAKANGVAAAVVVEASPRAADNAWLLEVTKDDPVFPAVVGNLRPGAPDFAANLEKYAADPRFKGIRSRVAASDEKAMADLARLAERGLSLDLLVNSATLDDVLAIARKLPALRIVLDHLAGAKVDGKAPDAAWSAKLREVAKHPNVFCKLSGLDQQAGVRPASRDLATYVPALDLLWELFGEDRLIYGSNWPVTLLRTDFATHQELCLAYVRQKGQSALDKVFWKNAQRVYRFELR
jgi:predicted TIM-barrel fold metal-dependent hydrolase